MIRLLAFAAVAAFVAGFLLPPNGALVLAGAVIVLAVVGFAHSVADGVERLNGTEA